MRTKQSGPVQSSPKIIHYLYVHPWVTNGHLDAIVKHTNSASDLYTAKLVMVTSQRHAFT